MSRAASLDDATKPVLRRQPRTGWSSVNFSELWAARELLLFYAIRDIKVRYKQTILGAVWVLLQPLLTMLVLSLFLGRLAGLSVPGVPYPLFLLCGLLPWQLFAFALQQSGFSLVNEADVIRKVYFPRLILPIASVLAGLVDFGISSCVLIVALMFFGVMPGPGVLLLPLLVLLVILTALAAGFWLSAINVRYRDVRYTIPFLTQVLMFVTPVAYPASSVPERWRIIYGLNPMAGIVEGFRWALLRMPPPAMDTFIASIAAATVLLVSGVLYFRRLERDFADLI
jgi:lipopolysaccharide transport system permease protein